MRRFVRLALCFALLFALVVYARGLISPLEIHEHRDLHAHSILLRGEATPYEFAVHNAEGEHGLTFYLNYLPEERVDWSRSLLAFEKVMAPWQDEIVSIRVNDGEVRDWWVAPEGETFCFGESPRNTRVPFHRHASDQMRGGCPDSGDPRGTRRTEFSVDREVFGLTDSPVESEAGLLRAQYRDLVITRGEQEVYRVVVDIHDESYLWTAASLEAGKLVRVPHGFTRLEFFDFVEVIDWRSGESERIALPESEGIQLFASSTWLRVDQEGELRLGGLFLTEGSRDEVRLQEYVLQSEARRVQTNRLSAPAGSSSQWGRVRHDWVDLDGRIAVAQASLAGALERQLVFSIVIDGGVVVETEIPDILGSKTEAATLSDFLVTLAPDQDGDGVDDILALIAVEDCPRVTHAWWFVSGATGQLLRR